MDAGATSEAARVKEVNTISSDAVYSPTIAQDLW